MRAIVPFVLLVIPLIEIALFVVVGDLIGLWPTLAATLLAAVIGIALIRGRGRAAVEHLRPGRAPTAVPLASIVHGAAVVMAGMLLLIPGFLTDLLGLSLLLPPVRRRLGRLIGARFHQASAQSPFHAPGFAPTAGPVIEGEAVVLHDPPPGPPGDAASRPPRAIPPGPRDPP